jgi:hypothetical protein
MVTKHALVWRGKAHDRETCLLCAGERLAALVRAALDRPGTVTSKDFRPAVEAFERLAKS